MIGSNGSALRGPHLGQVDMGGCQMHCTKCGTQIPDGTPFCSACGAPTTPVADASTENASPNPQAATPFAGAQTQPSHQYTNLRTRTMRHSRRINSRSNRTMRHSRRINSRSNRTMRHSCHTNRRNPRTMRHSRHTNSRSHPIPPRRPARKKGVPDAWWCSWCCF